MMLCLSDSLAAPARAKRAAASVLGEGLKGRGGLIVWRGEPRGAHVSSLTRPLIVVYTRGRAVG